LQRVDHLGQRLVIAEKIVVDDESVGVRPWRWWRNPVPDHHGAAEWCRAWCCHPRQVKPPR
jgi:hypothetical protein